MREDSPARYEAKQNRYEAEADVMKRADDRLTADEMLRTIEKNLEDLLAWMEMFEEKLYPALIPADQMPPEPVDARPATPTDAPAMAPLTATLTRVNGSIQSMRRILTDIHRRVNL